MTTYRFTLETLDGRKAGRVDWRGTDMFDALSSVCDTFPHRIITSWEEVQL